MSIACFRSKSSENRVKASVGLKTRSDKLQRAVARFFYAQNGWAGRFLSKFYDFNACKALNSG